MLMIQFAHLIIASPDLKEIYCETYPWTLQALPRIDEIIIIKDVNAKVKLVIHSFEPKYALGGKIFIVATPINTSPLPKGFSVR
jgi:hypothetical protein